MMNMMPFYLMPFFLNVLSKSSLKCGQIRLFIIMCIQEIRFSYLCFYSYSEFSLFLLVVFFWICFFLVVFDDVN